MCSCVMTSKTNICKNMRNEFVVFILSHGRANSVHTFKTLRESGYSGRIVFVVDNEDPTVDQYIDNFFAVNVEVFDKKKYADQIDEANNLDNRKVIVHARNACFDIAEKLGYKYFVQMDDDYTSFEHRYHSACGKKLKVHYVKDLDRVFDLYIDFYKKSSFSSIAFAQGGDFIGGAQNPYAIKMPLLRKCMNSFICSTDRRFQFIGSVNEDVNTYTTLAQRGILFGTIPLISLKQKSTQQQSSGMTDYYVRFGTYVKSFTTVMMQPANVQAVMLSTSNKRIHHKIDWNATAPKILSQKHRKL